jgi:hypothetical protein
MMAVATSGEQTRKTHIRVEHVMPKGYSREEVDRLLESSPLARLHPPNGLDQGAIERESGTAMADVTGSTELDGTVLDRRSADDL